MIHTATTRIAETTTNRSNRPVGQAAAWKYAGASGPGYKKWVNASPAQRYVSPITAKATSIAIETFHEATDPRRYRLKTACAEVTHAKKRKITVPCASNNGILTSPCAMSRITNGRSSVMTRPVVHVTTEKAPAWRVWE